jgi:hypothetical protein
MDSTPYDRLGELQDSELRVIYANILSLVAGTVIVSHLGRVERCSGRVVKLCLSYLLGVCVFLYLWGDKSWISLLFDEVWKYCISIAWNTLRACCRVLLINFSSSTNTLSQLSKAVLNLQSYCAIELHLSR